MPGGYQAHAPKSSFANYFVFDVELALTCIFHVLGRWLRLLLLVCCCCCFWLAMTIFACFVCCIIWLIRSICCFESPSLPVELLLPLLLLATITGELGADGDDEVDEENDDEDMLLCPSTLKGTNVAPCGELASPETSRYDIRCN